MRGGVVLGGALIVVAAVTTVIPYEAAFTGRTLAQEGLGPVAWALAAPALAVVVEIVAMLAPGRWARAGLGALAGVVAMGGGMTTWFVTTFRLAGPPVLGPGWWVVMAVQVAGLVAGAVFGVRNVIRAARAGP